jgi:hypothetical protein
VRSSVLARIVTGPAAFFIAWCIDLLAFAAAALRRRGRRG